MKMGAPTRLTNMKHTSHTEVHDWMSSITLKFHVKHLACQLVTPSALSCFRETTAPYL